jgi:hypothetical protein
MINTDQPSRFSEVKPSFFERGGLTAESAFEGVLQSSFCKYRFVDETAIEPFERFSELKASQTSFCVPRCVDEFCAAAALDPYRA